MSAAAKVTASAPVLLVSAVLALSACASGQSRLQLLQVPPERIVQKGYSFVPPKEQGWRIVERNPVAISLARYGETVDATVAINATLVRLPEYKTDAEFIDRIKADQANDTDRQHFRMLRHEVTPLSGKGTQCARTHLVAEDREAVKRTLRAGPMILELLTLTCAHPGNRSIGVHVGYSERRYEEDGEPAFLDRGSTVFDGVEFTAL